MEQIACSPCQILAEVQSLMSVSAAAKGLPLLFTSDQPLPARITSDPVRLRQILINLIGNAIKFTEAGMVQVVTRFLPEPGGTPMLQVDVIDTGIGITEEQVPRLFQPFAQADGSMTRRFGGTGLGFMISKRLAVMLGGDITIQSLAGQGSTFRLTVAAGDVEAANLVTYVQQAPPAPTPIGPAAAHPIRLECRILLAEDGPDNQRLLCLLLKKAAPK